LGASKSFRLPFEYEVRTTSGERHIKYFIILFSKERFFILLFQKEELKERYKADSL